MAGRIYCEQEVGISKTAASDNGAAAILTNILRYFELNFFNHFKFHSIFLLSLFYQVCNSVPVHALHTFWSLSLSVSISAVPSGLT